MLTALLEPQRLPQVKAVERAKPLSTMSWAEAFIVPGLIALQLVLMGDSIPFTHSFWLDEIHTQLLIDDPSLAHAAAALAGGVDFNPPTYYLLAKWISTFGASPEIVQRGFSLACVMICGISVYALLRDRCSRSVATAATLLIWSTGVVQSQAFEARFYAPWLAAIGLFSFCLQRSSQSRSVVWRLGLALSAVVICTVHYFGVISLGLLVAGDIVRQWIRRRRCGTTPLWVLPGIAALALCLFYFYGGQRSALSVATWVPPADWKSIGQFVQELVPIWSLAAAFAVWCVTRRAPELEVNDDGRVGVPSASPFEETKFLSACPAAVALVLMPVCLIGFSLLVQPALISRYGTVGTIGFAVLLAALLRPAPNWIAVLMSVWFFAAGLQSLNSQIERWRRMESRQTEMIARLRQLDRDIPLLFESRHAMYPIARYAPDLAPRVRFLALSDQNLRDFNSATPFRIVERDVAHRIEHFYPEFRTFPFDDLPGVPRAVLVAFRNRKDFGGQFDGFTVTQFQPQIFELTPRRSGRIEATRQSSQPSPDSVGPIVEKD